MITYCYSDDRRMIEFSAPMGKAPQGVLCGGRMFRRDIRAEHSGQRSGDPWTNHSSLALMVHPSDVMKARKEAAGMKLDVAIHDDGMVSFASRRDQKRYCRAYGYTNYDDVW